MLQGKNFCAFRAIITYTTLYAVKNLYRISAFLRNVDKKRSKTLSCNCEKIKPFAKKWLPVIGCAVAIVALIGVCCVSMSFNRKLSAVSGEVSAAVSELKDVSETLGSVSANLAENAKAAEALKKELDSVKEDLKSLDGNYVALTTESGIQNGRLNEIEAGILEMDAGLKDVDDKIAYVRDLADIKFEAEPYPATYEATERSIEEFRDCFISEILPYVKDAQGFTEEQLAEGLEQMENISSEEFLEILEMKGFDASIMKLRLTSPTTLVVDGNEVEYENRGGVFYANGKELGTISDEAIVLSLESSGIPGEFRLYRTSAPASTINLRDKIQMIDAAIEKMAANVEDNSTSIEDIKDSLEYYEEESSAFADSMEEALYKTAEYIDEAIAGEEDYISGLIDDLDYLSEDYEAFKEEVKAFADHVEDTFYATGDYIDEAVAAIDEELNQIDVKIKDANILIRTEFDSVSADFASQVAEVQAGLAEAKEELEALRTQAAADHADTAEAIADLEADHAAASEVVAALEADHAKAADAVAALEAKVADYYNQAVGLYDTASGIVAEFDGRLDSLEGFAESYGF